MNFGGIQPVPSNAELTDYIGVPDSVVSKRIYDILHPLNIHGIQLLPSAVYLNGEKYEGYWAIHIWNYIKCIDVEASDVEITMAGVYGGRIVIDAKRFEKIPLKERLIFRSEEGEMLKIFHKTIVEKILAVKPTGLVFTSLLDHRH